MKLQKFPQLPPEIAAAVEADSRSQFGALCYRKVAGVVEVLLITSRGTGRWIVPKGWPVRGQTPAGSALIEAYEEAGVRGVVHPVCLGIFTDSKADPRTVAIFPVRVKRLLSKYPEMGERKRKWLPLAEAADAVDVPELGEIIRSFDPAIMLQG